MTPVILIVTNEKTLQKNLRELLVDNGFAVHIAADGISAQEYINMSEPDMAVIDLSAPDSKMIYKEFQKPNTKLPVIILSDNKLHSDLLTELGIDSNECISKPLVDNEFLARIKILLRKQGTFEQVLQVADLELDSASLVVRRHGKMIQLTPHEFKLLQYLMSNKGRILTREMILSRIWLYSSDVATRVVDVYIGYLRKKVDSSFSKKLLHSVRGFGYVIKE